MNNNFPKTSAQKLPLEELVDIFLPKHFWSDNVISQLRVVEDVELIGSEDGFSVQRVCGSRDIVTSSSIRVLDTLNQLNWGKQIGPRAGSVQRVMKGAGGDTLQQDTSLYRIDGGPINIVRSVALLRKFGIELAHSWTVLCLRTQENICALIEERQKLGIPEVLIAGHARNITPNQQVEGEDTDIFYTRDIFSGTSIDVTYPMIDGRGFREGTIMWSGVKTDSVQGVLTVDKKSRVDSSKQRIPLNAGSATGDIGELVS